MASDLEHRRLLDHGGRFDALSRNDVFGRMGGAEVVEKLVQALYDGIESDKDLRALFAGDLARERTRVKLFFCEFFGGDTHYTGRLAQQSLKSTHHDTHITRALAGRWLGHFRTALLSAVADADLRSIIFEKVHDIAYALVNEEEAPKKGRLRVKDSRCSRDHPIHKAHELIRSGSAGELRGLFRYKPELLRHVVDRAVMLQAATAFDRMNVVELLIELGVDVNKPASLSALRKLEGGSHGDGLILITPLCLTRFRKLTQLEQLFRTRGAVDDVFSAAFLGDLAALETWLSGQPELVHVTDPACDALRIRPLHHAAVEGRIAAVRLLIERGATVRGDARALRTAVAAKNHRLVQLLLEHGADAERLGPGDWVLDPRLQPALARAGATVRVSEGVWGHWIFSSCTGNNRQVDNPEYVRALLANGGTVGDRLRGATALHYAARAGFVGTIRVLLEHGADRDARDAKGDTPLDWVERAGASVEREPVRRLLRTPS